MRHRRPATSFWVAVMLLTPVAISAQTRSTELAPGSVQEALPAGVQNDAVEGNIDVPVREPSAFTSRGALDLVDPHQSTPSVATIAQRSVRERRGRSETEILNPEPDAGAVTSTEGPYAIPEPMMMLYREGDFILDLTGRIIQDDETDSAWLAFERQTTSGTIVPVELNLLPCRQLELIQSDRSGGEDGAAYTVSGQVFVYKNANHLLITRARPVNRWTLDNASSSDGTDESDGADSETGDAEAADPNSTPNDESATGVLQRLLDDRQDPPTRGATDVDAEPLPGPVPNPGISSGSSGTVNLPPAPDRYVPESTDPNRADSGSSRRNGAFVVQRRARLTPGTELDPAVLRFDADGGGYDPPVKVLPCRLLEQMERMNQNALGGDPMIFEVTGQIHVYRGQAYILPRVIRRART